MKYIGEASYWSRILSLPSRERGLKCGDRADALRRLKVAPFAGAWIEITGEFDKVVALMSLPSRERGLKLLGAALRRVLIRRSLRGSVD